MRCLVWFGFGGIGFLCFVCRYFLFPVVYMDGAGGVWFGWGWAVSFYFLTLGSTKGRDGVLFHTAYLAPFHGFTGLHKVQKAVQMNYIKEIFITISAYSTS
ncbi:hypothetical protein ASPFODRAFT_318153 [Aspergillus luchuensis CBS 106.47]|uniref:Uncharacterized protein n=1 Tax=Aspergillus luchuensis (strain CBS 106.47) TaxID=1137211 RepID=A0A1M3T9K1_ASPLC|nr:hypothetical protein ASPFODRAFT_318153 [Aspergillus luchuensis CBS 106.47]